MIKENKQVIIYQGKNGEIFLRSDVNEDTVWATQKQIADIFNVTPQNITIHLKNIFDSGELDKKTTCKESLQVQKEGNREVKRKILEYNLDAIISVGYRIDSVVGTQFRKWATQTIKQHILEGYTIHQERLEKNKTQFFKTLESLKILTQDNPQLTNKDILSLIQSFSNTWFSLDSYDRNEFPKRGTLEEINTSAMELQKDLEQLKIELIKKGEATNFFAQEKKHGNLESIFGTVFQSVFGQDAYPTIEQKAAHLLYFIIKNHPFNDGNKRSGAFSFIWLLQKSGYNFMKKISPETLTTLTILIAESNPVEKEKMVGIILLLLNSEQTV